MITIFRDPTVTQKAPTIFTTDFRAITNRRRLDPEHFDPKYADLFRRLRKAGEVVRLGDYLAEPVKRGVQPEYVEHGGILVINSQHVQEDKIDIDTCAQTTELFVAGVHNKGRVKKLDVLLNSTGYSTIGRAQCVIDDLNAIVDSHVSILRPKAPLDPVYLSIFLNSGLGYLQTEQAWTGSSGQIELSRDSIADFQILLPPESIQREIRKAVEKAHELRREARRLIDEAHRSVENFGWGA